MQRADEFYLKLVPYATYLSQNRDSVLLVHTVSGKHRVYRIIVFHAVVVYAGFVHIVQRSVTTMCPGVKLIYEPDLVCQSSREV